MIYTIYMLNERGPDAPIMSYLEYARAKHHLGYLRHDYPDDFYYIEEEDD